MAQPSSERPGPGTATGRVWEIADELSRREGNRARRAEVIEAYVSEGGNPNTAHTQFQRWRTAYEANRKRASSPATATVQMKDGGRILLPAELRAALGVSEGDALLAEIVDGELRLRPRAVALKQARAMVRSFVPEGVSLVDALLADRRDEERRDAGK